MKNSEVFKKIVQDINSVNKEYAPRWQKIHEAINTTAKFSPITLAFDYHSRKISWKYIAAELTRYLSWDLKSENIGKYANMWNNISNIKWMVNSNYWYIVFLRYIKWYYNQYNWVIKSLKKDKDSRQAIIRYNDDKHAYEGNQDFVCTLSNQFLIRDNKLHMIFNMRSSDIYRWLQYDLIRFWLLQQSVRLDLLNTYPDLELWDIYYNAGSAHYYERMYDISNKIVNEEWKEYKIILNKSFDELHRDIFNAEQYRKKLENTTDYKKYIKDNLFIDIKEC